MCKLNLLPRKAIFYVKIILTLLLMQTTVSVSQENHVKKLLKNNFSNWGKWGEADQIGALNYLDKEQTMRGVRAVKQGKRFTLQIPMTHGTGPVFPGRTPVIHFMAQDESLYFLKNKEPLEGGIKYSDDAVFMYLQGTSHVDALGHAWYGEKLYGGFSAKSSTHGHSKVDIAAIGEEGITGRGVLLDIGRLKGDKKGRLKPNTCVNLGDLLETAKKQGIKIEKRDILLIRTGSVERFYDNQDKQNWNPMTEPGLCYSKDLVAWLHQMEIPVIASDNLGVEKVVQEIEGETYLIPLHGLLIRDLGIVLSEIYLLDKLADDCHTDKQYTFLFTAAPLKMVGGTGSPVNPIVIK
ncbi:MAG: cyclase family protein [Tenacibaculum sp.]